MGGIFEVPMLRCSNTYDRDCIGDVQKKSSKIGFWLISLKQKQVLQPNLAHVITMICVIFSEMDNMIFTKLRERSMKMCSTPCKPM